MDGETGPKSYCFGSRYVLYNVHIVFNVRKKDEQLHAYIANRVDQYYIVLKLATGS